MALDKKFPRESLDDPYLPPVEEVMGLRQKGMSNDEINSNLQRDNFSSNQIDDAITQADIKKGITGKYPYSEQNSMKELENSAPSPSGQQSRQSQEPDMEPSTQPYSEPYQEQSYEQPQDYPEPRQDSQYPMQQPAYQNEHVDELVESVINEKWEDFTEKIGDVTVWKEKTRQDIESIKQEILRFESRLENMQRAVIGKVTDYNKDIQAIGTDVRALEQVLQKILGPLTTNVKELSKLAEKIKTAKSSVNAPRKSRVKKRTTRKIRRKR